MQFFSVAFFVQIQEYGPIDRFVGFLAAVDNGFEPFFVIFGMILQNSVISSFFYFLGEICKFQIWFDIGFFLNIFLFFLNFMDFVNMLHSLFKVFTLLFCESSPLLSWS